MKLLNETQKSLLTLALQIAAEKFSADIDTMNEAHKATKSAPNTAFRRMANQFQTQKQQAEELADLISEHDGIALHNENDMLRSVRGLS